MVLCSPSLLTARERDSSECGNLLYLKERELVYQRGSLAYAGGDELAVPRAARHYYSLQKGSISIWRLEARSTKSMKRTVCSGAPGEDSTGAGAERELGFDPQPKAELAQGEYKGAPREVLARHVHTAEPRGGPGGC